MEDKMEDNLGAKFGSNEFSVPENYFEQLNRDIQTRVAVERLREMVPADGFTVPALYFEQLSGQINAKIQQGDQPAQPKRIRLWQTDFFQYAAAACFILVAAFGFYANNQMTAQPANNAELVQEQMLYEIDEAAIVEQLQIERVSHTNSSLTDQQLEEYILNNYSQTDLATNL